MVAEAAPAPANRFERRRRQNRAALLEAAFALFQRQGLRATRLEEICERADVSSRTFFNHFETREHLYRAIAKQRAQGLAERFDAAASDPRPLPERLRGLLAALGGYLAARPRYRELVAEMLSLRGPGGSEIARGRVLGDATLRFVEAAVARGEVGSRHAPEVLADLLLGALMAALVNWCADDGFALEAELDRSSDALLDLLAPNAGPSENPTDR
jgi:AcrR family transcriptional regulator